MLTDDRRAHFLQLSIDFPPEPLFGMGIHVADLSRALSAQGHRVTVATRNRSGRPEDSGRPATRERVLRLPLTRDRREPDTDTRTLGQVGEQLAFCRDMAERIQSLGIRADVIHNHGHSTVPLACELSELWDVPLISTVHVIDCMLEAAQLGSRPRSVDRWTIRALEAEGLKRSQLIAVPSAAVREAVADEYPTLENRIHVLPHPRPDRVTAKASYRAHQPFRVLTVGRLISYKGVAELLDAIDRLPPGTVECWIVGRGVQEAELRQRATRGRQAIRWLGQLPHEQVLRLYAQTDTLVVPSVTETYGMVLQEGLQAGLPVIAAELSSFRDRVEDRFNGLLVPVENGPRGSRVTVPALADALRTLRTDEELRRRLGRNAASAAEKNPAPGEYAEALRTLTRPMIRPIARPGLLLDRTPSQS